MIDINQELVDSIKKHEGFRGEVYQDHLGFDTVGYGTKMPLSEKEAAVILTMRLNNMIKNLELKKPFVYQLPREAQNILSEMAYQLGVVGLLNFRRMWIHLRDHDFHNASVEMLDSKWASQTPSRAYELSLRMKNTKS